MAEDQPGRPGSGSHDQPGHGPTEPLGVPARPAQPAEPPPASGQPAGEPWAPAPTAPLPGGPPPAPAAPAAGPPPPSDGGVNVQYVATGPFILVELAYFTYFHATSAGQSIGNKILGIRVLHAESGRPLPHVRAFVRALVSNLSALALFLGFFWMLWEPRKRTWHDIVADSLVVSATAYPPGEFGRPAR